MHPKEHLIIGFVASLIIVFVFDLGFMIWVAIFLGSIFIDLDHAMRYTIKTKNFNPFKFWKWSMKEIEEKRSIPLNKRKSYRQPIFIFHGVEFWLIILILGYWHPVFLWILLGMMIHIFSDHIDLYIRNEPHDFKLSVLWAVWKNKSRKDM